MSEGNKTLEEEIRNLSHDDLCEITQSSLRRLIAADKLLQDLPGDVTTEEVVAQVAVAQGQSITVTILRNIDTPLSVVIPQQGTTVLDLKKAIRRCFTLRQQRTKSKTKISWKYVWRTYYLKHDGAVLTDDSKLVDFYGVQNKSELSFTKRLGKRSFYNQR